MKKRQYRPKKDKNVPILWLFSRETGFSSSELRNWFFFVPRDNICTNLNNFLDFQSKIDMSLFYVYKLLCTLLNSRLIPVFARKQEKSPPAKDKSLYVQFYKKLFLTRFQKCRKKKLWHISAITFYFIL